MHTCSDDDVFVYDASTSLALLGGLSFKLSVYTSALPLEIDPL